MSIIKKLIYELKKADDNNEIEDRISESKPTPASLAKKHGVSIGLIRKQLKIGTGIEGEHTKSKKRARKIAMDHEAEIADYYTRLKRMEKQAGVKKETVMGKLANEVDPMEPWSTKYNVREDALNERDGALIFFIKSKGLDPSMMDGNMKAKYSRSSEHRLFKKHQLLQQSKKPKEKLKETSGMGERGDDWNEEKKIMSKKDDPCWSGYRMYGKKKKNGKEVPNCVPENAVKEGIYGIEDSPMSATNSVKAMESDRIKTARIKMARMIKEIHRKYRVQESLYDHEKDDKEPSKVVDGQLKSKSKQIPIKKTLTGTEGDVIDINPELKKQPIRPDNTEKK